MVVAPSRFMVRVPWSDQSLPANQLRCEKSPCLPEILLKSANLTMKTVPPGRTLKEPPTHCSIACTARNLVSNPFLVDTAGNPNVLQEKSPSNNGGFYCTEGIILDLTEESEGSATNSPPPPHLHFQQVPNINNRYPNTMSYMEQFPTVVVKNEAIMQVGCCSFLYVFLGVQRDEWDCASFLSFCYIFIFVSCWGFCDGSLTADPDLLGEGHFGV